MSRFRDPKTPEEWQWAVDAAAAARAIFDCKLYGLLEGGPEIDADRCDQILKRGAARGITPSAPAESLALDFIWTWNSGRIERTA